MRTLGISLLVLGLILFVAGLISFVFHRRQATNKSIEDGMEEIDPDVRDLSTIEATSHEIRSEERT